MSSELLMPEIIHETSALLSEGECIKKSDTLTPDPLPRQNAYRRAATYFSVG
jgi:hypothetical protein